MRKSVVFAFGAAALLAALAVFLLRGRKDEWPGHVVGAQAAEQPSSRVQKKLDHVALLIRSGHSQLALRTAINLANFAESIGDIDGEGVAQTLKARALDHFGGFDRELAAWGAAATAFQAVGDIARQVEALANMALLQARTDRGKAYALIAAAVNASKSEGRPPDVVQSLNSAALRSLSWGRPDLAAPLLTEVDRLSRGRSLQPDLRIGCLNTMAELALENGAPNEAEADLSQAHALESNSGTAEERARTLMGFGDLASLKNQLSKAEYSYLQAERLIAASDSNSSMVVKCEIDLGGIENQRYKPDHAWSHFRAAENKLKLTGADAAETADCMRAEGRCALDQGQEEIALYCFASAYNDWRRIEPQSEKTAACLCDIGLVDFDEGVDKEKAAEANFKAALSMTESVSPKSPFLADIFNDLASVVFDRDNPKAAETFYLKALDIDWRIDPGGFSVAKDYASLGHAKTFEWAQSRDDAVSRQAIDYLEKANGIIKANPDFVGLRPALAAYQGNLAFLGWDPKTARACDREAVRLQRLLAPDSIEIADFLGNEGNADQGLGRLREAEECYSEAWSIYRRYPEALNRFRLLHNISAMVAGSARFRASLFADDLALRRQFQEVEDFDAVSRSFFSFGSLGPAETDDLVAPCVRSGDVFKAYDYTEQIRGLMLSYSILAKNRIRFALSLPKDLAAREENLELDQIGILKDRMLQDRRSSAYRADTARLARNDFKRAELRKRITREAPGYASLMYPKTLGVSDVQQCLEPGTLLLEYSVGPDRCCLFAVEGRTKSGGSERFRAWVIKNGTQALSDSVSQLLNDIHEGRVGRQGVDLYNQLVGPALRAFPRAERLLICAPGFLANLPFCCLIDNGSLANPHYLIESKPIDNIVSMSQYALLEKERKEASTRAERLVAFADPAYRADAHSQTVSRPASFVLPPERGNQAVIASSKKLTVIAGKSFSQIPETAEQVNQIVRLWRSGADVYLGIRAIPQNFFAAAPSADILHMGLHAWDDEGADPLSSFLALSPSKPGDLYSLVTGYDIVDKLRLRADLVTLDGCATGAGQQTSTEGIIGLGWLFQYAGAHSVLSTRWEVKSYPSGELLCGTDPLDPSKSHPASSFYGFLFSGMPKDEALQKAQIAMIRGAHPYHPEYRNPDNWAAFELQGDWK